MATEEADIPESTSITKREYEDKDQGCRQLDKTVYEHCPEELKKLENGLEKIPETVESSTNKDTMKEANAIGLITVNAVIPGNVGTVQGESFLNSPTVDKVASEETCSISEHGQVDKVLSCTGEEKPEHRSQQQEDHNLEAVEETRSEENEGIEKTKEIVEKGNDSLDMVYDIETSAQKANTEEPALKVGGEGSKEERNPDQHDQIIDNQQASMEENPESIKEVIGSEKEEKVGTKMDQDAGSESTKQFSHIIEATSSQNKGALDHTPDPADNLDKVVETGAATSNKEESIDKNISANTTLIEEELAEKNIREEDNETEKHDIVADMKKGSEATRQSENARDEKYEADAEQILCDESMSTLKGNPCIQNDETKLGIGEGSTVDGLPLTLVKDEVKDEIQDKNLDSPYVTQKDETCVQKEEDLMILKEVSKTECIDVKSPVEEHQTEIFEKIAQTNSTENENIKDSEIHEEKLDRTLIQQSMPSKNEGHDMTKASVGEKINEEKFTVQVEENNSSTESVVDEEHLKEDMLEHKENPEHTSLQHDAPKEEEKLDRPFNVISEMEETVSLSESTEVIGVEEENCIKILEENFEKKGEEDKPTDTDEISEHQTPEEKESPLDLDEMIERAEVEISKTNENELDITHSFGEETEQAEGVLLDEVAKAESEQLKEASIISTEACKTTESATIEYASTEEERMKEAVSITSNIDVGKLEKIHSLDYMERTEVGDAKENVEEEIHKNEETYATAMKSDDTEKGCIEEDTSVKVHSAAGVEKEASEQSSSELSVQSYRTEDDVASKEEEVQDKSRITATEEVTEEQIIEGNIMHVSPDSIEERAKSFPDNIKEAESSKEEDAKDHIVEEDAKDHIVEEDAKDHIAEEDAKDHIIKADNVIDLLPDSVTESWDFQENKKESEKSKEENFKESETTQASETFAHETNQVDESPAKIYCASMGKQEERQQKEVEDLSAVEATEVKEMDEGKSSAMVTIYEDSFTNQVKAKENDEKEKSEDEEDAKQILQQDEPGEKLEQPSHVISKISDAGIANENPDKIICVREERELQNLEEDFQKERKEETGLDTDDAQESGIEEEDIELLPEASEETKESTNLKLNSKEGEIKDEKFNMGYKSDSKEKSEGKDARENMAEVYENPMTAAMGKEKDLEKHDIQKESTYANISPKLIGEGIPKSSEEDEGEDKSNKEVFEITSTTEDTREQMIEEIGNFKDQSPKSIEEEILKETSKENEEYKEFKASASSTKNETQTVEEHAIPDLSSLPAEEKSSKECETDAIKIKEEIEDSNLERKEQIEATCSSDKTIQSFKDREETTKELDSLNTKYTLDDKTLQNKSNESLVECSLFPYLSEEESKNDNFEKEEANTNDSKTVPIADITTELKCSEITEPEGEKQVENSDLTSEDKPLATTENEDTIFGSGGTKMKQEETSKLSVSRDKEILTLVNEAEGKVEYAMPDTESEDQREVADKDKLLANKANTIIDETQEKDESQSQITGSPFNPETPEEMSLQTEDEPTYPKEESNSAFEDMGNNSANEEVMKQGHEELAMPPVLNTEKHLSGSEDVVISEEASETAQENEICKADILQDKGSSNLEMEKTNSEHEKPLNEASNCIEALGTRTSSENAILEEVEPEKNFEGNLKEVVEEEKTSMALVTEICRQGSGASDTKEKCTLTEEDLELAGPGKRVECIADSEAEDLINKTIIETSGTKIEEPNNSIQYQNIDFVEQQITGPRVQEGEKEANEKVELELDDEKHNREAHNKTVTETTGTEIEEINNSIQYQNIEYVEQQITGPRVQEGEKEVNREVELELDNENHKREAQSANEKINYVILTEEDSMETKKVDEKENTTEQIIQEERGIMELHTVSAEDETVNEVFEKTSQTEDTREQIIEEIDNFKDQSPKSIEEGILKKTSKEHKVFEGTSAGEDTNEQIIKEINNFKDQSPEFNEEEKLKESSKENEEYEEFKVPDSSTNKETQTVEEHAISDLSSLPVEEKMNEKSSKECETEAIKIEEEIEDSNLEMKEQIEATCSTDEKIQTLEDRAETTKELDALHIKDKLDDETLPNESNESLVDRSLFPHVSEEENKNDNFEKEEASTNDSKTATMTDITTELKCSKLTEPEGEKQVENSDLTSEDKPLATTENEDTIFGSGGTNVKPEETSKLSENRDKEILALVDEAEEKVEYAMPDTESEGQREIADKDKLLANKANTIIDESQSQNTGTHFNPETPEEMSLQTEDEPTYPKEESNLAFVDIGNNIANEEVMKQGHEELAMPPEQNTEKHLFGSKDVVISEEASEIAHENEICKADILQDKDSSNLKMENTNSEHEKPLNEASKCIEVLGTRTNSENAILEEVESAKNFEGNLKEVVEEEKTPLVLVTEVCRQGSEASDTKENCTLTEENLELADPGKRTECLSESEAIYKIVIETSGTKIEETHNSIQYQNIEFVEQQITGSRVQEGKKEVKDEVELELDDETQSANKKINYANLTEEDPMEAKKVDQKENIIEQIIQEDRGTMDLHTVSAEDEKVNEVKGCASASIENVKLTDSAEQIETVNLEADEHLIREQDASPLVKASNEAAMERKDIENPVNLTVLVSEESEEKTKEGIIEQGDNIFDKLDAASLTVVTEENILGEPQPDYKPRRSFNNVAEESNLQLHDSMKFEETSDSDSKIPTIEYEDEKKEIVTVNKQVTNEIEESKNASHAVSEYKDQSNEEIEEIREAYEEIPESKFQCVEAVTEEEIATNVTLPAGNSEEVLQESSCSSIVREQGHLTRTSLEKREDRNLNIEDSFGTKMTEEACLQKEEPRELKVSEQDFELTEQQKDSRNEALEEEGNISFVDSKLKPREDLSEIYSAGPPSGEKSPELTRPAENISQEASKDEEILDFGGSGNYSDGSATQSLGVHILPELDEKSKEASYITSDRAESALEATSEFQCHNLLISSEETELKVKHIEAAELIAEVNQNEAIESIKNKVSSEKMTEKKEVDEEFHQVSRGQAEIHQEDELMVEEYSGDQKNKTLRTTQNRIQNEELSEEIQKASASENITEQTIQEDRAPKDPYLVSVEHEAINESLLDEAGGKNVEETTTKLGNDYQVDETNFKDNIIEAINVSEQVLPDSDVEKDDLQTSSTRETAIAKKDEKPKTNLGVPTATDPATEEAVHENVGENFEETYELHPSEMVHEVDKTYEVKKELAIAVADNQESLMDDEKHKQTSLGSASDEIGTKETLKLKGHRVSPESFAPSVSVYSQEETPDNNRKNTEDEKQSNLVYDKQIAAEMSIAAEKTAINDERDFSEVKEPIESSSRGGDKKPDEAEIHGKIYTIEDKEIQDQTIQNIQKLEKTSDASSEMKIPREVEPNEGTDGTVLTGNKDVELVVQDPFAKTLEKTEMEDLKPQIASRIEPELKGAQCDEEKVSDDVIEEKISSSDLLQESTKQTWQLDGSMIEDKEPTPTKEEIQSEKDDILQAEETKTDEEKDEEDEQKKVDSGSDAPVMVEASRDIDMDVKVSHKKSHGILSGVSSKVKHSISKVKKAITGKSSNTKSHLPKQKKDLEDH